MYCINNKCNKANANTHYLTSCGYVAYIPQFKQTILFPTEQEYLEYIKERNL